MRLGFLGKGAKGEASLGSPVSGSTVSAAQQQTPQKQQHALVLSENRWQENFAHCLSLLRGPADETRFVGLLLVTKLLAQGGDAAVLQVLDALGPTFMDRLLLPLTRQKQDAQPPTSEDAYQQEILSCSLALAILSSACRIPEVAAGQHMLDRIPALVKVVKAGGVHSIIPRPSGTQPPTMAPLQEQTVDGQAISTAETVTDALECLVSIAGCGRRDASAAVLVAGGLEAATKALAVAAGSSAGSKKGSEGRAVPPVAPPLASDGSPGAPLARLEVRHTAMLAVRLVALLLEYGGTSKTAVLADYTDVLQHTVAALGMLIGHPSVLAQQQQQQEEAGTAAPLQSTMAAGGVTVAGVAPVALPEDAAMLQLEALHAMLLVLPLPQELELHHRLAGAVHRQEWPAAVRRGLNWLLRSRISAVQKHSALQLAAAMVELAGPAWLLARGEQRPEAFLQVLAETLHVETALLLHDALYPDQHVREEGLRSDTRQHWQAPQASEPFLQSLRHAAAAREAATAQQAAQMIATAEGLPPPPPPPLPAHTPVPPPATVAAATAGDAAGRPVSPLPAGGSGSVGFAGIHTAGERAARLLPCCYLLLECTIEVLASDSAMQEDDMMVIDEAGESEEEEEERDEQGLRPMGNRVNFWEGSKRSTPQQRQGQQLLQPGVSPKAAQQLMYNLETTVSVILQFMDELQEQGGGAGAGSGVGAGAGAASGGVGAHGRWAAVQADLALGAVRVLGRFLAEAPEAHTEEFRKALPFMLRIGSSSSRGIAGQATQDATVMAAGPVQFLLPGLLQATSYTSTPATQLRRAICKSPAALHALGGFLEAAADEAAQLAASLQAAMDKAAAAAAASASTAPQGSTLTSAAATAGGTPGASSSGGLSRSGSVGFMTAASAVPPIGRALRMAELGRVERLMADVSALLLNVLDAKDLAAMAAVGRSLSGGSRALRSSSSSSSTNLAAADAALATVSTQQAPQPSQPSASAGPSGVTDVAGTTPATPATPAVPPVPLHHLGPVTRVLLPAVASLGRWWRARSSWCTGDADLTQPHRNVEQLAAARLMPRTALCCGTLAGGVLDAAARQLAARASAAAAGGDTSASGAVAGAAAMPSPLPPAELGPVCDLVVQALQAGCCLSLTMMEAEEDVSEDVAREAAVSAFAASMVSMGLGSSSMSSSSVSSSGSSTPKSPRSVRDPMLMAPVAGVGGMFGPPSKGGKGGGGSSKLTRSSAGGGPDTSMALDDFPGDAEHAWQRLGGAVVSLSELLPPVQATVRNASWIKQLLGAAATAGGVHALTQPSPKQTGKRSGVSIAEGPSIDVAGVASGSSFVLRQQELLSQASGLRNLVATLEVPAVSLLSH